MFLFYHHYDVLVLCVFVIVDMLIIIISRRGGFRGRGKPFLAEGQRLSRHSGRLRSKIAGTIAELTCDLTQPMSLSHATVVHAAPQELFRLPEPEQCSKGLGTAWCFLLTRFGGHCGILSRL